MKDSKQSTILVTFQVIPCGDGTAHMRLPSSIPDMPGPGLEVYVPHGLPHPEMQAEIGVSGNQFKLTGFLYRTEWHHKNSRTVTVDLPHRIDLTAWEIVVPYEVWVSGADGSISTETHTAPIKFMATDTIEYLTFNTPFEYSGC